MTQLQLRSDQLDWRLVAGEIVALDLRTSRYLSINGSGATLWQRLAEGASREDLVDALTSKYDVEATRAEADVDAFLDDLRGRDLIADS